MEPLNFARSNAKADAMRLPVRQDLSKPANSSGHFLRSKSWLLPLKSGPHEFVVAEGRGPNGEVKSCGIGAPDVDGNDFKAELIKAAALAPQQRETVSQDGDRRVTFWRYGRQGLRLMLTDGTPKKQPGIYLILLQDPQAR